MARKNGEGGDMFPPDAVYSVRNIVAFPSLFVTKRRCFPQPPGKSSLLHSPTVSPMSLFSPSPHAATGCRSEEEGGGGC